MTTPLDTLRTRISEKIADLRKQASECDVTGEHCTIANAASEAEKFDILDTTADELEAILKDS